jgi:hypothetical protein
LTPLAKTAGFGERILLLGSKFIEPTFGRDEHVVGVYETLFELTVELSEVMPVLHLAVELLLQKLGVRPCSEVFSLNDEGVNVEALKAKLAEPVKVFHNQTQISVQGENRFV